MLSSIFLKIYCSTCALKRRDNSLKDNRFQEDNAIHLKQILLYSANVVCRKAYIEPCFIKLYKIKNL